MKFYESLIMLRSATTESQVDELEKAFGAVIEKVSGTISKFDRWGKLKLAHPVEHKDYAYFVLVRYKIEDAHAVATPKELSKLLKIKLNAYIIRYVSISLSEESFEDAYKRPESFIPSTPTNSRNLSGGADRSFGQRKSFISEPRVSRPTTAATETVITAEVDNESKATNSTETGAEA